MFKEITKWSVSVHEVRRIPEVLTSAFRIAESGRPGPVFVELPFDIQGGYCREEDVEYPDRYQTDSVSMPNPRDIEKIAVMMQAAKKPLLIAGTNVYWEGASEALTKFVEKAKLPTFTNGMGRGTLSMEHEYFFSLCRSNLLRDCDLVLNIGTPFDFRIGYGKPPKIHPEAKVVTIDNQFETIGKNRPIDVGVCAHSGAVLEALAAAIDPAKLDYSEWLEKTRGLESQKLEQQKKFENDNTQPMNSFRFARGIADYLESIPDRDDTVIVCDGGDVVANVAKTVKLRKPGRFLDPGPLGCLGMGGPMALAAKKRYPDNKVLLVYGDGSFGFNGFELESAVRHKLPIVTIVGNDAAWNQIRCPQVMMYGEARAVASQLLPTRYDKIVEAFGGKGEHVEDPAEIPAALARGFDSGEVYCINVAMNPKGNLAMGAAKNYAM